MPVAASSALVYIMAKSTIIKVEMRELAANGAHRGIVLFISAPPSIARPSGMHAGARGYGTSAYLRGEMAARASWPMACSCLLFVEGRSIR